jgi:hypothetical protein
MESVSTCSFAPPFRKAKFCGVPSRAIAKVGCAMDKKVAEHYSGLFSDQKCLNALYFSVILC